MMGKIQRKLYLKLLSIAPYIFAERDMKIFQLVVFFLFVITFCSCEEKASTPSNILPEIKVIDTMKKDELLKYAYMKIDPFDKDTSFYLTLFTKYGTENRQANCIADSGSASIFIEPDIYLSSYSTGFKIISDHNPVYEGYIFGNKNKYLLNIREYLKYLKDSGTIIRLYDITNGSFDLTLDENEKRGVYLMYRLHQVVFNKNN